MFLFKKNPNEAAYVGGKKHWADVIKNSGSGDLLIWRQPEEDFNTNSTLIVMPGEEAIFVKGGTIEQIFESGTYQLSTQNYPFISRLRNAFTGGISTFNCVVYFIRKADSYEIFWGTQSPIQVRDKVWNIRTSAKANGAYKLRIENPGVFLEKLIGNNIPYQTQEDMNNYFANEFQGSIKTAVSKLLNSLEQELIGIDAHLDSLSAKIEPSIDEIVSEYGLKCVKFSLALLDVDVTKYDEIDESQVELIARTRGYQGDKAGLTILGDDWLKVHGLNVLKDLANNPGAGGVAAAGAGVGMGVSAAGAFSAIAQQVFSSNIGSTQTPAVSQPSGRFVQKQQDTTMQQTNHVPSAGNPYETLSELKRLLDSGLINQSEYDMKKADILKRM